MDAATMDAATLDAAQPDGERCNGVDDDGDGAVDEGFDLERDPNHCGACDRPCGRLGMREVCRSGVCLPTGCEARRWDANLDASDGCEAAVDEVTVYYVRAGEPGGDGNGVGTRERPFATIAAALATGGGDDEIVLLPGTFHEAVTVAAPRVWLHADVPDSVVISSPDERPAVTIGGFWSRVEGVTLRAPAARTALELHGRAMEVHDVAIEDVHLEPAAGGEGPVTGLWIRESAARVSDTRITRVSGGGEAEALDASGVFVSESANDVTIVGLDVTEVRGGDAPRRGFAVRGGSADGVRATGASRLTLVEARLLGLAGGAGSGLADESLGRGGDGGSVTGLRVEATAERPAGDLVAEDLTIGSLGGGAAGVSSLTPGGDQSPGANGGAATGVSLVRADDARIRGLHMSEPTVGGPGSAVSPEGLISFDGRNGAAGSATGVSLVESRRLRCTASSIDGLTAVGGSAVDPPAARSGFHIDADSRGAVIDASVRVHGDPVWYVDGGRDIRIEGQTLRADVPATNWGRIAVRAGTGVTVAGNTITNAGGPAVWFGGSVVGVFLGGEATSVTVEDNVVGPLVAGDAEVPVTGLVAEASPGDLLVVRGNRFLDLCGACVRGGPESAVVGVATDRSLSANNNLFARFRGGSTLGYRLGLGVGDAVISRETWVDFSGRDTTAGVFVSAVAQPGAVTVRNSLFDGLQAGLQREGPEALEALTLDWALLFEVEAPVVGGVAGEHVSVADPLLDPLDDYRPLLGSPAIDAGDPRTVCLDEPPDDPDGLCRVDLGHTGNTAAAQSVEGR
jgi:hypothetical protein